MINELLLIKLITANENNFSLQLNFEGLNSQLTTSMPKHITKL